MSIHKRIYGYVYFFTHFLTLDTRVRSFLLYYTLACWCIPSSIPNMKQNVFVAVFFTWMLFITPASANVLINEIAWMGTDVSSTNEWIELYNSDANPIDISGWKIDADDGSPSIPLSGIISSKGYFLIERTDDETIPNIPADLVVAFGNGLSNAGETLRLRNQSAIVIDTVIGGTDWVNIGGDKTTKATAQRTMNSWVTGVATPRAQNITQVGEVLGAQTNTSSETNVNSSPNSVGQSNATVVTSSVTGTPRKLTPAEIFPRSDIAVSAGDDKRVLATFPVVFTGVASGVYGEPLDYALYNWNFGDGGTGEGKMVTHTYDLPGEYLATLDVRWSKYTRTDRMSVLVTVPEVVIGKIISGDGGYVEILNHTDREMDMSGWSITGGVSGTRFIFPSHSIILAKKVLLLPNRISHLGDTMESITLHYPDGRIAFEVNKGTQILLPTQQNIPNTTGDVTRTSAQGKNILTQHARTLTEEISGATSTVATVLWEKDPSVHEANVASRALVIDSNSKWLLALLTIILIVFAGFLIAKSHRDDVMASDEYAIIEDIIEGGDDLK